MLFPGQGRRVQVLDQDRVFITKVTLPVGVSVCVRVCVCVCAYVCMGRKRVYARVLKTWHVWVTMRVGMYEAERTSAVWRTRAVPWARQKSASTGPGPRVHNESHVACGGVGVRVGIVCMGCERVPARVKFAYGARACGGLRESM